MSEMDWPAGPGRRAILAGLPAALCGGLALRAAVAPRSAAAADDPDPTRMRPQVGDRFAYYYGDRKGETLTLADVPVGQDQQLVYPLDPETGVMRNGTRLNMVMLLRLDPARLDDATRDNAAEGVVCYSAVCTHQGCPVVDWKTENSSFICECHGSQFDPAAAAKVLDGPAPSPLAMLPIAIEGERQEVVVAGAFTRPVGGQRG